MIEQLITDHLDLWSSAVRPKSSAGRGSNSKLELTGIKKLRELILELAVCGKLVPQDPNDEPASVLLERIAAEKARLVKEGKIKKSKPLAEITDDEKPFELPEGWEWCRLGYVGVCSTGKTPSTSVNEYFNGDIPFIGPGQITQSGSIIEPDKYLSESGLLNSEEANQGDVFTVCIGGSIGKSAIVHGRIGFNQQINAIKPIKFSSAFLYSILSTRFFIDSMVSASTGSATPIINRSKWESLLIPCASMNEQHRIVAKVDELMSLCDQLEQKSEASLAAHQTLVETLLATLTESADSGELAQNWARLAQYFDSLFTTQSSIDALKQTILQLAVMGKLVPQDPNDEPASVLLERIAAEKARLVKEGKIKKSNPLPEITDDEKPFELPEGWKMVRLGQVSTVKGGKRLPAGHQFSAYETAHVYIRVTDMKNGSINDSGLAYISPETHSLISQYTISSDDLYITIAGTIGDVGLVPSRFNGMNLTENAAKLMFRSIDKSWLKYTLRSKFSQSQFNEKTNQLAQPKLALHRIESSIIALPPIAEQKRIVAKVDELMFLCDQISARLQASQTTQQHLAEALVEGALN
ncbi:restriction endonuclease subunit S [Aeromonas sp. PrichA-15]|uniref:restriction endonuclease subunit S n=1 Tax=Aeromonas sp. PrichA-15 TaxID=2823360 RepID=UPI001B33EB0B|nr:restriction endonuclease subunit S [Aeromonas sp. PrichA-15]MBP4033986.1 restriction endonuclease subunit S [Aeromonas sp. PrichA-15]